MSNYTAIICLINICTYLLIQMPPNHTPINGAYMST